MNLEFNSNNWNIKLFFANDGDKNFFNFKIKFIFF